ANESLQQERQSNVGQQQQQVRKLDLSEKETFALAEQPAAVPQAQGQEPPSRPSEVAPASAAAKPSASDSPKHYAGKIASRYGTGLAMKTGSGPTTRPSSNANASKADLSSASPAPSANQDGVAADAE